MKFNKKHQAIIAVITLATFCWLIHLAAMPVGAANGKVSDQPTAAREEQPGVIEDVSTSVHSPHKTGSSLLSMLIVGVVAVAAVTTVLILVSKDEYDIRGTWAVTYAWQNEPYGTGTYQIVFSGSRSSGTFIYTEPGYPTTTGTYTVDGKNVSWTASIINGRTYTGTFTTKDTMSGTMNYPGSWTAVRIASAASVEPRTVHSGMNGAGERP